MIVFGEKATLLLTKPIPENCINCKEKNTVNMSIFQKYAHIFWIPIFPINKTGVTECEHCKQVLTKKEFPPTYKTIYKEILLYSKNPIWTFSGLAIIIIIAVFAVVSENNTKSENIKLINSPKTGDIYEVKLEGIGYTLYKINNISGDTVFVLQNRFVIDKISGLYKLKDDQWDDYLTPILKKDLKTKFNNHEIIHVTRK